MVPPASRTNVVDLTDSSPAVGTSASGSGRPSSSRAASYGGPSIGAGPSASSSQAAGPSTSALTRQRRTGPVAIAVESSDSEQDEVQVTASPRRTAAAQSRSLGSTGPGRAAATTTSTAAATGARRGARQGEDDDEVTIVSSTAPATREQQRRWQPYGGVSPYGNAPPIAAPNRAGVAINLPSRSSAPNGGRGAAPTSSTSRAPPPPTTSASADTGGRTCSAALDRIAF